MVFKQVKSFVNSPKKAIILCWFTESLSISVVIFIFKEIHESNHGKS